MAEYSVNYIIKLLSDDSELKKQLQSSEKEITKLNAHERAEVKKTLQEKMDALEKTAKSVNKQPNDVSIIDVDKLKDELEFIQEVFKEMKALNPAEDWAKSGKLFVESFSKMHTQLSDLATVVDELKTSVSGLGNSFKDVGFDIIPVIDTKSVTKQATRTIDGVGDVVVNRVHGVSKEIQKAYNKANETLSTLKTNKATSYDVQNTTQLNTMLKGLHKQYLEALNDSTYAATAEAEKNALVRAAKTAKEYFDLVQWANDQAENTDTGFWSSFTTVDKNEMQRMQQTIDAQIDYANKQIERYHNEVQQAFELNLVDKLTKNLKGLNLSIELPKQADFVKKINKFIDSVNQKNLHQIKVQFDDLFEPKKKKSSKKNKQTEDIVGDIKDVEQEIKNADAELDDIIDKSGLAKLEAALDKMQKISRDKTTAWRQDMKQMLVFKEGDFQFHFGNSIMKDLQEYFAEPGHELEIFIDEEGLKQRIENVIKSSGGIIGSPSSTATFDPKTMASAVYSAIKAAFTGQEMPSFDFSDITTTQDDVTNATKNVEEATADTTEQTKKYVKTLDESTIHLDKVIESLKKFAKIAPNSKAGRTVDTWFSDRGINMSLIRAGAVDDAEIRTMLQESWLSADNMGYATGSMVIDQIEKYFAHYKTLDPNKGAGKDLSNLQANIRELFKMLDIPLETVEQWKDRTENYNIYESAAKYGRGLALLNKFRPKLHPGKKNDAGQWKRSPEPAMVEGATTDDLSKIKVEDIDATIQYFEQQKNLLLQKKEELNAKIANSTNNMTTRKLKRQLQAVNADLLNFDTQPLEDLKAARIALGNSTVSEEIKAFQQVATQFYENSRRVFDYLNKKFNFSGELSIQGRNSPIEINNPNDLLNKALKDAVITGVKNYKDMGSSKVGSFEDRKSESQALSTQGQQAHQSKKEYEQDILYKEIKVQKFKPEELDLIQPGVTEQHVNTQLASVDNEIKALQKRIEAEKSEISELIKTKEQLETGIATLVGEDVFDKVDTSKFKTQKDRNDSVSAFIRSANNALSNGANFSADNTKNLSSDESDLVKRLQIVLKNINEDTAVSQDLENRIADLEDTTKSLSPDEIKYWKSIIRAKNNTLAQRQGYNDEIKQIKQKQQEGIISEDEANSKIAEYSAFIEQATKDISLLDADLETKPKRFFDDLLFDRSDKDKQMAKYQAQKAEVDASIQQKSKAAKGIIAQLEEFNKTNIATTTEEAKVLAEQLGAIKESLYAEAEKCVAILTQSPDDENTKGKLQQLLSKLTKATHIFATVQPFVQDVSWYNETQSKNVEAWNKAYTNQDLQKLQKDLSALEAQLKQEKDVAKQKEIKRKITSIKGQITKRRKITPENVTSVRRASLSQTETQLTNKQAELQKDKNRLKALEKQANDLGRNKDTAQFLDKYKALLDKEKKLIDEIAELRQKGAKQSDIDAKLSEHTQVKNDLIELYKTNPSLSKKAYGLKYAKQYQLQLIEAYEQQRAMNTEVADIDKWTSQVKTYGLKAGYGDRVYNRYKWDFIDQFRAQTRDKLKNQLGLNDAKFQVEPALMSEEVYNLRKRLYETLEERADAIVAKFKDPQSMFVNNQGLLEYSEFEWNDETNSVVETGHNVRDIRQDILNELANRRDIALGLKELKEGDDGHMTLVDTNRNRKKELEDTIKTLQEERDKALEYGGLEYDDLKNDDLIKEQIQYQQQIEELLRKKKKIEEDESKDDKTKQKEMKPLNEEIRMLQSQILNREKLIELRAREKEENKFTAEESQIYYTDKLIKSKERLKTVTGEIATLEQAMQDAIAQHGKDSEEAVKAKYAYDNKIEQRKNILKTIEFANKKLGHTNAILEKSGSTSNGESKQGGIFGGLVSAIKEGISSLAMNAGTIDVDNSDIATETTLRAIFEMLSGGGQASADLDAEKARGREEREARRKEEQARIIAEAKVKQNENQNTTENKRHGKIAQAKERLNSDGQAKFDAIQVAGRQAQSDLKNFTNNDIVQKIKDKADALKNATKDTEDYLKGQYELANMVFAYANKLKESDTNIKNYKDVLSRSEFKGYDINSLIVKSAKDVADNLIKLGYEAKLSRNTKDINKMSDDELGKRFKHLLQLLSENKATELEKTELNKITDLLSAKGLINNNSQSDSDTLPITPINKGRTLETDILRAGQVDEAAKILSTALSKVDLRSSVTSLTTAYQNFGQEVFDAEKLLRDPSYDGDIELARIAATGLWDFPDIKKMLGKMEKIRIKVDTGISEPQYGTPERDIFEKKNQLASQLGMDYLEFTDVKYAQINSEIVNNLRDIANRIFNSISKSGLVLDDTNKVDELRANYATMKNMDASVDLGKRLYDIINTTFNYLKHSGADVENSSFVLEKKKIWNTTAEVNAEPIVENDTYKKAVETVRNAIGDFDMRSSKTAKAEKYASLGQEIKDAGNEIYKNLANATKEEKALVEKLIKLRDTVVKPESQKPHMDDYTSVSFVSSLVKKKFEASGITGITDPIANDMAKQLIDTIETEDVAKEINDGIQEAIKNYNYTHVPFVSDLVKKKFEEGGITGLSDEQATTVAQELIDTIETEDIETEINKAIQEAIESIKTQSIRSADSIDKTIEENVDDVSDGKQTNKTQESQGGIIGIMRSELAQESTLKKVLTALGEIAKKNAMSNSGKSNSAQDLLEQFRRMLESDTWEGKERVAYIDLETGSISNSITGDDKEISIERLNILRDAYKNMDVNAMVHTHANEEDPYFSLADFDLFGSKIAEGITKHILLSKNNMTVLDMTDVKDIKGLLSEMAQTEQNFESLAATANKFGARYASSSFEELQAKPQQFVKMLGIKGIESKYTAAETRESARQGVLAEDAKEAADILQESTGRAIKKTVERVGIELETLTEKTDTKGNKTWSSQIGNKFGQAMRATNKDIESQKLDDQFGAGTKAAKALAEYRDTYKQLIDYVNKFNTSTSDTEKNGLQQQINELIPVFNKAEKELVGLIARKEQFLRVGEKLDYVLSQDTIGKGSLETIATKEFFGDGLTAGQNIATAGTQSTQNGRQLLVDVLDNGTISRYGIEVDEVTGQVRKLNLAESDLVNAFQNVNRAMRDNERVMASVAIGDSVEQVKQFLATASSPILDTYKSSLSEMQTYTANLWNVMKDGESVTQDELDYLMALSERVITLGKNVQKTSIDFRNFWTQNPDNVFGHTIYHQGYNRNDRIREELENKAKTYASASNSEYNFSSFDNDTLQFTLTDVEGKITKVTYAWNELYQQIAVMSDKATSALDPMVAKINRYDEALRQAKNDGYLMGDDSNFDAFYKAVDGIKSLARGIEQGIETFDTAKDKLYELRQEALNYGEQAKKTAAQNKRLFAGTGAKKSVDNQYNKIIGARRASGQDFEDQFVDDSPLFNEYYNAYNQLNKDYQTYVNNHQLNDPKIQQQIQQEASKVQTLGKKYLSSVTQATKLKELAEQSGTYIDVRTGKEHQLGGWQSMTDNEIKKLDITMRDYARSLYGANLENIKINKTTQTLTGTVRTSKDTVADIVVQYNNATQALYGYSKQERESLTGFAGFMKSIKGKMKSILQYTASITSIYRVIGELKRGIQYIREIDSALTELKKVTSETKETYENFLQTAAKTADKVGSTIKEVVSSTADWARLGYSLTDATTLAETTSVLLNVSEFQSIEDATSALTSTLQAFSMTAETSMRAVDVLNEIGKLVAYR